MSAQETPRTRVPADIGVPDRIVWGLTFRQLSIIGSVALAGWYAYTRFADRLPPIAWVVIGLPVAALAATVALGRRDGMPFDRWLLAGLRLAREPRVRAPGVPTTRGLPKAPAPLRLPATAVDGAGRLTSADRTLCILTCGAVNIHLRTPEEQAALLDGFGRWLNSLSAPAQIVVSARIHDLRPYTEAVERHAMRMPNDRLREAAEDHAAFLAELAEERTPLRRRILVVVDEPARETSVRALSALGVDIEALDGSAVTATLSAAVDPFASDATTPRAIPDRPVRARRMR